MTKPNIVFIFADQLRYGTMGCSGNPVIQTPSFDRLGAEGVVFDQAFSSCPICAPYRGQILTGNYSHINGVICNEYLLHDNQNTIAHILKKQGYKTAFIGKWHLGHPPYTEDKRYGFDYMYAYNCNHNYYKTEFWHNEKGPFKRKEFAPRIETAMAVNYIKEHIGKSSEKPFCLFMGWGPPHWSWSHKNDLVNYTDYPQEHNIYNPEKIDVPGNVPLQFLDFAGKEIADYYGMVSALDECMKEILETLDECGIAEETILCFSSDHGDHLSAHGYGKPNDQWMHHTLRGSKATPHEESIHVPFMLRYPSKVAGGHRTSTMFNSVDVMPTLLGLCGVDVPDDVQGKNLSHAVLGQEGQEPDSVYLQILGPGWPGRTKWLGLWRGIRTPEHVYARWKDCGGKRVLYDLKNDPLEMNNLIDEPDHAEIAENLEKRLQQWIEETRDPFDTGERLPITGMLDIAQSFSLDKWYQKATIKEYAEAIEKYRSGFKTISS